MNDCIGGKGVTSGGAVVDNRCGELLCIAEVEWSGSGQLGARLQKEQ